MFEQVLQTFWAKKILIKSLLISALDKVFYCIGTFSQGLIKPLCTYKINKIGFRSAEKLPFFNMLLLAYIALTISLVNKSRPLLP
jgi:hypothetical protein